MKIAYVYDAVYPYRIGGVERRIYELSRRLAVRGHEVHIFGLKEWQGNAFFSKDGVHYHGLGRPVPFYSHGRRSITEAYYFAWKALSPLLKGRFDIIDCQNFPYFSCFSVALASKVRKIPFVITWHEVWNDYWTEYLGFAGCMGKVVERLVSRLSPNLVAVSGLTKRDLMSMRRGIRLTVIPNGIDFGQIEAVSPSEIRSDIVFSGRLIKEKNVDLLIGAMDLVTKEIPGTRCIIAGDGPERAPLERMVRELHLEQNIKFIGFLNNHAELTGIMKSSKVCASPSTREGFGMTALEAMACGLPVVTFDAPKNAVKELVNEKTGLVSHFTPEEFAESIIECLNTRELRAEDCVKFSQQYDWLRIIEEVEDYYDGIIKQ